MIVVGVFFEVEKMFFDWTDNGNIFPLGCVDTVSSDEGLFVLTRARIYPWIP